MSVRRVFQILADGHKKKEIIEREHRQSLGHFYDTQPAFYDDDTLAIHSEVRTTWQAYYKNKGALIGKMTQDLSAYRLGRVIAPPLQAFEELKSYVDGLVLPEAHLAHEQVKASDKIIRPFDN